MGSLVGSLMMAAGRVTLALLKPDVAYGAHAVRECMRRITDAGLVVRAESTLTCTAEQAASLYKEHEGRFYHARLIDHIRSGPVKAMVLEGDDAVARWRAMLGPSAMVKWAPGTIRASFGVTDTRNAAHGSDSAASAAREIAIFFPSFSI